MKNWYEMRGWGYVQNHIQKIIVAFIGVFLIGGSFAHETDATHQERYKACKVLIVDGFSNHDWKRTTQCLGELLKNKGGYDVTVSTFPADKSPTEQEAWCPIFKDYDVVIQNTNDGVGGTKAWPKPTQLAFEKYIAQGGSMMAFHSANNAFASWPEYNKMLGLAWRPASYGTALVINKDESLSEVPQGEGQGTSHGQRFDAIVTRLGDESIHPIYEGLPKQWKAQDIEVYSYTRGPAKNVTVLSYALEPKTQLQFPIEWVVQYGKGRIYTSTLGHLWPNDPSKTGIDDMGFQTMFFRAMSWLAHRPIDKTVPTNFPAYTANSQRKN